MPIPKKDETQDQWMSRCVPQLMRDEGREQAQAVAMRIGIYREHKKSEQEMAEAVAAVEATKKIMEEEKK